MLEISHDPPVLDKCLGALGRQPMLCAENPLTVVVSRSLDMQRKASLWPGAPIGNTSSQVRIPRVPFLPTQRTHAHARAAVLQHLGVRPTELLPRHRGQEADEAPHHELRESPEHQPHLSEVPPAPLAARTRSSPTVAFDAQTAAQPLPPQRPPPLRGHYDCRRHAPLKLPLKLPLSAADTAAA